MMNGNMAYLALFPPLDFFLQLGAQLDGPLAALFRSPLLLLAHLLARPFRLAGPFRLGRLDGPRGRDHGRWQPLVFGNLGRDGGGIGVAARRLGGTRGRARFGIVCSGWSGERDSLHRPGRKSA